MTHIKTAGLIVIGDEILRGQTMDTNSSVLCRAMHKLKIPVKRIVVIPDVVESIAEEIRSFASSFDYVLTTGGVGATHDDVTYEGVARAFNSKLTTNPVLAELISELFGITDLSHPAYKMSLVPEGSRVLHDEAERNSFPLVAFENVFMFPGIPKYMEQSLPYLLQELRPHSSDPPHFRSIYLRVDEVSVARTLNEVVKRFERRVSFGSYPSVSNNYYTVQITIESNDNCLMKEAEDCLRRSLPEGTVVSYNPIHGANLLYDHLENERDLFPQLSHTIRLLEECLCDRYSPSEICISFNGGKDCTALLHLYHAVLERRFPERSEKIVAFYVDCSNSFPEVKQFVKETVIKYNLDLCKVTGSIKDGLKQFLAARPHIKAILMGNRRTDPHCDHLQPFQETDSSWPKVMRVFPLLDWSYSGIWTFLRHFYIPYCSLYDTGYTSLGSRHNTAPNPNLKYVDDRGNVAYHPAHTLNDGQLERNGRLVDLRRASKNNI